MLKTNTSLKKSATLSSPILGIPKLDFDLNSSSIYSGKKAAGRDEDTGYVSGNRRKIGTSPNSSSPNMSYSERLAKFDSLRKQIKEKQAELENLSAKISQPSFTSSSNNEVDLTELKVKIKKLQDSINEISLPTKNHSKDKSDHNPEAIKEERKKLESEFSDIVSELPSLTKKVHALDEKLAESRLELFKVTDAKIHKTAAPKTNLANLFPFKASGSNENLTEADKLKQKAAEMLAQRMQALTKADVSANDPSAIEAKKRLDAETEKINKEKKANERYIREAEDSIRQLQESIRDIIQRDSKSNEKTSHKAPKDDYEKEKKKWDSRFGLEAEIKKFLDELKECERKSITSTGSYSTQYSKPSYLSSSGTRSVAGIPSKISSTSSKPSILASAKSKEEKDRIIKEEAERRLKERQSFFQTQFQRTKEQKSSLESKVEKVENNARSGGDSDYAQKKLASIEREKEEIEKKFLQRSREFSDIAEKTKEERSQVDSIQTSTNHTSSDAVPPPPPPPPPANKSGGSSLGGYKTLWLNNPSSTKSGSQPSKSVTPSFIPKSNNPFPVSTSGKVKSPVVPKATTKDDSEDEDDKEKEKEYFFQDRIE
ncbi:actin organization and endocytosis protein, partial [Basidiobolus ranarum]